MGISVITENIAISPSMLEFSIQNLILTYSAHSHLLLYIFLSMFLYPVFDS